MITNSLHTISLFVLLLVTAPSLKADEDLDADYVPVRHGSKASELSSENFLASRVVHDRSKGLTEINGITGVISNATPRTYIGIVKSFKTSGPYATLELNAATIRSFMINLNALSTSDIQSLKKLLTQGRRIKVNAWYNPSNQVLYANNIKELPLRPRKSHSLRPVPRRLILSARQLLAARSIIRDLRFPASGVKFGMGLSGYAVVINQIRPRIYENLNILPESELKFKLSNSFSDYDVILMMWQLSPTLSPISEKNAWEARAWANFEKFWAEGANLRMAAEKSLH